MQNRPDFTRPRPFPRVPNPYRDRQHRTLPRRGRRHHHKIDAHSFEVLENARRMGLDTWSTISMRIEQDAKLRPRLSVPSRNHGPLAADDDADLYGHERGMLSASENAGGSLWDYSYVADGRMSKKLVDYHHQDGVTDIHEHSLSR
jgi:hypothetical protein